MQLLPNYQKLSIANKEKYLNKYLNLKSQDSFLPISLRTAKQDPEPQAGSSDHKRLSEPRASEGPFPGGKHSGKQHFMKKTNLIYIDIKNALGRHGVQ